MKMMYLLAGLLVIILAGLVFFFSSKSTKSTNTKEIHNPKKQQTEDNVFFGMRDMALGYTAEDIGSENESGIYGIVMDWDLGNGIVTLVAFKTGDASLYMSSGGAIIGGGGHESVRNAVFTYIKMGNNYLTKSKTTEQTPLPKSNGVNFYFLNRDGKFLGQEDMSNIENGNSEWLPLFNEANKVLSELRLTTKNM